MIVSAACRPVSAVLSEEARPMGRLQVNAGVVGGQIGLLRNERRTKSDDSRRTLRRKQIELAGRFGIDDFADTIERERLIADVQQRLAVGDRDAIDDAGDFLAGAALPGERADLLADHARRAVEVLAEQHGVERVAQAAGGFDFANLGDLLEDFARFPAD